MNKNNTPNEQEDFFLDDAKDFFADERPRSTPVYQPFLMPIAVLLGAVLISGTIFYTNSFGGGTANIADIEPTPEPVVDITLGDSEHVLGNADAKVTIVEYSDLECPFCRRFYEGAYQGIKKEYIDTGKAKLIFRHFPLDFHPYARLFATAAECAGKQGRFYEMHDKIFYEQAKFEEDARKLQAQGRQVSAKVYADKDMITFASQLKYDVGAFTQCIKDPAVSTAIDEDTQSGSGFGVNGTPTVFVNGVRVVGAQPFEAFKQVIEAELAK